MFQRCNVLSGRPPWETIERVHSRDNSRETSSCSDGATCFLGDHLGRPLRGCTREITRVKRAHVPTVQRAFRASWETIERVHSKG